MLPLNSHARDLSVCVCVGTHTSGFFRANVLASKQIIAYTSVVVLTSKLRVFFFFFFYVCSSLPFSACAWEWKYFFCKSFDLKIQHKFSKYLLQSVFKLSFSFSISVVDRASLLLISIIERIMPDLMN